VVGCAKEFFNGGIEVSEIFTRFGWSNNQRVVQTPHYLQWFAITTNMDPKTSKELYI
jgi:hypothetical protein